MPVEQLTCKWCGDEFARANPLGPTPKYCRASHKQRAYEQAKIDKFENTIKYISKKNRKLQERLNRIANLTPGKRRIWDLSGVADTLEIDVEIAIDSKEPEAAKQLKAQALFTRRFAWDMGELRIAVHGESRKKTGRVDYVAGKYDPDNWKGPRP